MNQLYYKFKIYIKHRWTIIAFILVVFLVLILMHVYHNALQEAWCSLQIPLRMKLIGLISSLVTIFSIVIVYATLKQTQSLFEAEIMNNYNIEYESDEMYDNLRILRELSTTLPFQTDGSRSVDNNENKIPEIFKTETPWVRMKPLSDNELNNLSNKDKEAYLLNRKQDRARRKVKFFFINSLDLYEKGKLSLYVFERIIDKSGISLLFNVVEHMEYHINENYDYGKFYRLMLISSRICKKEIKTDKNFSALKTDITPSGSTMKSRSDASTHSTVKTISLFGIPLFKETISHVQQHSIDTGHSTDTENGKHSN